MRNLRLPVLLACLLGGLVPAWAKEAEIEELRVELVGEQYFASFRVEGAFTADLEERIASGLETSFRHRIRVLRRRGGWVDKVLREEQVTTTVKYDSLTRQYTLFRLLNGKLRETEYTESTEEMRLWMSELSGIPVGEAGDFDDPGRVYVKVKSNVRSRFLLFFIPVRWNTDWVYLPFPGPGEEHE